MSDHQKQEGTEKKLLDPEKNVINISMKKPMKTYVFIAKLILKKFGDVELHSLGKASENVVKIAERLQRQEFAVVENIESCITDISDNYAESGTRSELSFKVLLKKSDKFDELTKDLKQSPQF